ncbi:MAG: N-formylglutamate amidohydrolase [Rhodospirillales bacterium]|nr:N-formylglutamate amidohydrolase [Rhodospirillales bacterium]
MIDDPTVFEAKDCPGFPAGDAFTITAPERQTVPVVFASPHSGRVYPDAFLAQSCLDPLALRRSEDAFVDELFDQASDMGAPLITAQFPRVYVDVNREPNELDPAMFSDSLPTGTNTASPRVTAGLGTIAKIVSDGQKIYDGQLRYGDVQQRIEQCYVPYHRALMGLVEDTMRRFGTCLVVDCHSMPTRGGLSSGTGSGDTVDLVLGDCWGSSCHHTISDIAEHAARDQGFVIQRNTPYAGGFTTRHYGRPSLGMHAIQLEIDRALYMDEEAMTRLPEFDDVRRKLTCIALAMVDMGWDRLAAE